MSTSPVQDARSQFPHYHKFVKHLDYVDVYRVLQLFNVTDPCIQHAVKKLLVSGKRSAGKSREQDIREAIVSLNRALQMIAEDDVVAVAQHNSAQVASLDNGEKKT